MLLSKHIYSSVFTGKQDFPMGLFQVAIEKDFLGRKLECLGGSFPASGLNPGERVQSCVLLVMVVCTIHKSALNLLWSLTIKVTSSIESVNAVLFTW